MGMKQGATLIYASFPPRILMLQRLHEQVLSFIKERALELGTQVAACSAGTGQSKQSSPSFMGFEWFGPIEVTP